jgi:Rha family phage regulatory protein
MSDNFRIQKPFEIKPPRLKDLVDQNVMGDAWIRDTPFAPVTDSLKIAEKFGVDHKNIIRSIEKCISELGAESELNLSGNIIENVYLAGPKGRKSRRRKYDITEFGLALILLYINSPHARIISAKIIYHFFVLKTYLSGLKPNQINAIRGYYRKIIKDESNLSK